jgi:hypothetical protein
MEGRSPSNRERQSSQHAKVGRGSLPSPYTDKKENKIFLIYKEIQMGAVAKSYIWKGFLI